MNARLVLGLVGAVALLLQASAAVDRDLHMDETHYARLAAEVGLHGNLLLRGVWNDRPLVFYYLLAPLYCVFGLSDRLSFVPNVIASLLMLVAAYGIVRHLHGERAGVLGAAFLAVCPLFVAFAPTVFQEPTTVAFALLGVWALVAARPLRAGLLYGLAAGTKQLALAFAPLVGAFLLARALRDRAHPKQPAANRLLPLGGWLFGCSWVLLPMLLWAATVQRPRLAAFNLERRPQTFELAGAGFATRAGRWLVLCRERLFFDSKALLALYGVAAGSILTAEAVRARRRPGERAQAIERLALHGFSPALGAFLALGQLELWDRYVYPLGPTAMMTLGVGVDRLATSAAEGVRRLRFGRGVPATAAAVVVAAVLLPAARPALDMSGFLHDRLTTRRGGYFVPASLSRGMRDFLAAPPTHKAMFLYDNHLAGWPLLYYLFDTGFTPRHRSTEDLAAVGGYVEEMWTSTQPRLFLVTDPAAAEAMRAGLLGSGTAPRQRGRCRLLPFRGHGTLFYCP